MNEEVRAASIQLVNGLLGMEEDNNDLYAAITKCRFEQHSATEADSAQVVAIANSLLSELGVRDPNGDGTGLLVISEDEISAIKAEGGIEGVVNESDFQTKMCRKILQLAKSKLEVV